MILIQTLDHLKLMPAIACLLAALQLLFFLASFAILDIN